MWLTRSTHLIFAYLVDFVQFLPGAKFVYGAFGVYFVFDKQYIWAELSSINHIQITITDNSLVNNI